jgi:hypothetical protein
MFIVNHFMSEKVPKRTIIKRAENCISAKRKLGSGRHRVTFHQIKNSSFSYWMDQILLNATNITKVILI